LIEARKKIWVYDLYFCLHFMGWKEIEEWCHEHRFTSVPLLTCLTLAKNQLRSLANYLEILFPNDVIVVQSSFLCFKC